ncbi:uroporphyrinogen-III synthase [Chiayiivirga flava]|uniref:Uroporphyrinogen-III synthase n=1 Tax=Chiayiivirga flava TaxID=659595 RepID=A0A7W8D720_9GAMM|nr:uroporphyrinogen-III synthase [Chiayiivirga flava]MBB5207453.1 uroporphyrinogen-III synthase [Chiayiivirga flava]
MTEAVDSGAAAGRLHGWAVVCLRPRADQRAAAAAVRAFGARPLALPGLRLERAPEPQAARAALAAALDCDDAVFTSPAAVRFAARVLPLSDMRKRMFAVGSGTAAALRAHGLDAKQPPPDAMHGDGVLALPELAAGTGPVGIVTAPGGRDAIPATLRARGRAVRVAEVYRRLPPRWRRAEVAALVGSTPPRAVLVTSAQALRYVLDALPTPARATLLASVAVVSSDRLRAIASDAGFAHVLRAPSPTIDALLAALAADPRAASTAERA